MLHNLNVRAGRPRGLSNFEPDDITVMCSALDKACAENQVNSGDSSEREQMALRILARYRPHMPESDLVRAAKAMLKQVA